MTDTRGKAMMLKLYIKYPLWGEVDPVDDPWNVIYKELLFDCTFGCVVGGVLWKGDLWIPWLHIEFCKYCKGEVIMYKWHSKVLMYLWGISSIYCVKIV